MTAADRLREWRKNPLKFVHDVFNIEPETWQAEALMGSVEQEGSRHRVAMKSCTGAGKSAVLAWIGWHRLSCFGDRGEHPKGAAISGEGRDNLRDNLWTELSKWQQRSPFLMHTFEWNKEQIKNKKHADWFLSARGYARDADSDALGRSLSGLHSKYPFVLLDETGAMPPTVGQKSEQIFTGGVEDGLIMQAGNPTSNTGLLYHTCTQSADSTIIITITADPDDPKRTSRVDVEHAREQIKRYGRDNPWVMSTILGLFPPGGINTLISIEDVEAAMDRRIASDMYVTSQKRLGVDVARFGDDRTILCPRQGLRCFSMVEMRSARSNEIAARVALAKANWKSDMEFVDGTGGYGSGVIDSLIQAGHTPQEIHFSSKAIDNRYFNKRAEMWFNLADWVRRGAQLPKDGELLKELTSPTYTFQNGKFRLEEKDQIKSRLGFSPDKADALCLTFALPEMAALTDIEKVAQSFTAGKLQADFDPFEEKGI